MSSPGQVHDKLLQLVGRVVQTSFEAEVERCHGDEGVARLVELIDSVKRTFQYVPFEWMTEGLTFIMPIAFDDAPSIVGGGRAIADLAALAGRAMAGVTIVAKSQTSFEVVEGFAHKLQGDGAILTYQYVHLESERVIIEGQEWDVDDTGWPCAMAAPTFTSLEQALDRYVALNRRPEYCAHLSQTWRDPGRLGLLPKPERHMRRSLFQALRQSLSGAHVEQEQNQDETKPVDIEVTWWNPGRVAIIEVKWLGRSGPAGQHFTTVYKEPRALEGLKQLADYLDRRDGTNPEISVYGYIFVFDARRRGLKAEDVTISRADGVHFADLDPRYPDELLNRPDVGRPFRVFMEPVS